MAGATEVYQFIVTCDPPTPKVTPQVTNITMPTRTVLKIRVRIPPGPSGVMGFAIGSTGVSVIPTVRGTFIVASDEVIEWEPDNFIDSGSWQIQMYNTGRFGHSIYVTFTVELPDQPGAASAAQPIVITGPAASGATIPPDLTLTLPAVPELT